MTTTARCEIYFVNGYRWMDDVVEEIELAMQAIGYSLYRWTTE